MSILQRVQERHRQDGPITPYTLSKDAQYLISLRPTAAVNCSFFEITLASAAHRTLLPGGTSLAKYGRAGNTGAFTSISTTVLPVFMLGISRIHDGASSGGIITHPGMSGGMRG